MKNRLLLIFLMLLTISVKSQEKIAQVTFDQTLIDYGTVEHGADGKKRLSSKILELHH